MTTQASNDTLPLVQLCKPSTSTCVVRWGTGADDEGHPWSASSRRGKAECCVVSACAAREVGCERYGPMRVEATGGAEGGGGSGGGRNESGLLERAVVRGPVGGSIPQRGAPGREGGELGWAGW